MFFKFRKRKIKIVVVGNCQSRPIAAELNHANPDIEITQIAVVHLLRNEDFPDYEESFRKSDFIVSQLVADNYPCEFVRTNFLKQRFGNKVVTIVNLFFSGYNPDWRYIRLPGAGALKGPMGDYHNSTIFDCWRLSKPYQEAAENCESVGYNLIYSNAQITSIEELKERERNSDVNITDHIEQRMNKERLFFTMNHPSNSLIQTYTHRLMMHLDISIINADMASKNEALGQFKPKINPVIPIQFEPEKAHQGVIYSNDITYKKNFNEKYSTIDLARIFYNIYDKNESILANG